MQTVGSAAKALPISSPDDGIKTELLDGICNDVYSKTPDASNPSEYGYAYERKIYAAARVDFAKDTAQSARAKIRDLWNSRPSALRCIAFNFQINEGDILKYAVEMKSFILIDDALAWQINLNMVDSKPAYGWTLLDFIELKIAQNPNNELTPVLIGYWSTLKKRGALRCHELAQLSGLCTDEYADMRQRGRDIAAQYAVKVPPKQ